MKNKVCAVFFNVKIPLGGVPDYGEQYAVSFLASTDKTVLPMGIIRVRATEYNRDFCWRMKAVGSFCRQKIHRPLQERIENCKIISSDIQKTVQDSTEHTNVKNK